jgi:hypothetical protein
MVPGTNQGLTIDNATDTLSTTMPNGDIVIAFPVFGTTHSFIVTRTGKGMTDVTGRANTVTAFLETAECYSDNAYAMISERWV